MPLTHDAALVSIGIQARSTSDRLPGKSLRILGKKTLVEHVLHSAKRAAARINSGSQNIVADVSILVPRGDAIVSRLRTPVLVAEADENDVLSRYVELQRHTGAEYLVRLTGDCPLIPPAIIVRHVFVAVTNQYDYLSNVDERCRTAPDGWDCEVISKRLLEWLDSEAEGRDREHVTTLARRQPPPWAKQATLVSAIDLSHQKLSVDTEEDFVRVEGELKRVERAIEMAARIFGTGVHRI